MRRHLTPILTGALLLALLSSPPLGAEVCQGFGPQTPRDIAGKAGANPVTFAPAPPAAEMNLCNIHFHKNAEHKGPGFSDFAGTGTYGGYRCNGSAPPSGKAPSKGDDVACENVRPGDTIEVHWVHSSCDVEPGPELDACSSEACLNPQLRVETQVFLVVDDAGAADFEAFSNAAQPVNGRFQARAFPSGTGEPVTFLGSTTGPKFDERTCSPLQVTWSVRPRCARVDLGSLQRWCKENVFKERRAHGVRPLVTDPRLLSEIP